MNIKKDTRMKMQKYANMSNAEEETIYKLKCWNIRVRSNTLSLV